MSDESQRLIIAAVRALGRVIVERSMKHGGIDDEELAELKQVDDQLHEAEKLLLDEDPLHGV